MGDIPDPEVRSPSGDDDWNLISGRVIVRGTVSGVQNLLVVAYDLDAHSQDAYRENLGQIVSNAVARGWIDFPGARIGSVLTGQDGSFALPYRDEAFDRSPGEYRPDLVFFVLSPDLRLDGTFLGQPLADRILHYAFVVRKDAGRREALIVALDRELLDQRQIAYPGSQVQRRADQALLAAARRQQKEATASLVRDSVQAGRASLERRTLVKRESWQWLMPSLGAATSGLFARERAEVPGLQRNAMQASVSGLQRAPGKIAFSLTSGILDRLGVAPDDVSDTPVEISLCNLMALKGFGTELVRVQGLLDIVRKRRTLASLAGDGESESGGDDDGDEDSDSDGDDEADFGRDAMRARLDRQIAGQVASLAAYDGDETSGPLDDLLHVQEVINRIESGSGPANITAFHDFHSLQIAFKSVWTAAFDARLQDQAAELFDAVVRLDADYGVPVPDLAAIRDVNDFRKALADIRGLGDYAAVLPVPPDVIGIYPQMTQRLWNELDEDGRSVLETESANALRPYDGNDINPPVNYYTDRQRLNQVYIDVVRTHRTTPLARAEDLALDLADRLTQPHAFQYYAPGSYNLALLTTYRQEWWPEAYQTGRLVSTIPMAPGEKRSFRINRAQKRSRIEREVNKSLVERASEGQTIARAETDVMSKTATTTNFQLTAQGSISFGIGSVSSASEFGLNQAQESTQQKKAFNEATRKSAEKVRQEREIHVEETGEDSFASEATHEISNPNNEITVTYLLYELERRYRIRSRLHRVTPVIMVAMEIPSPHEITPAWVLEHSWILRRSLLDDYYSDAISMIQEGASGKSMDVEVAKANFDVQRRLTESLEQAFSDIDALLRERQDRLINLTTQAGAAAAGETEVDDAALAFFTGGLSALFASDEPSRAELLEARRKGAEQALKYAEERAIDLRDRLASAQSTLAKAGDRLIETLRAQREAQTRIDELFLHIKQNILHYMHNVWDHRHPDQIYFQNAGLEIELPEPASASCLLRRPRPGEAIEGIPGVTRGGEVFIVECAPPTAPRPDNLRIYKLQDIADLDQPLGYKGNYILYRLKTCTVITDFMIQNYVDDHFGLKDPALETGYDTAELLEYAREVLSDREAPLTAEERSTLVALVARKLQEPSSDEDMIIVPTGQLFMDALKGGQTLLESFKRAHRGLDVLKVEEEVRTARLESLRRAARLLQDPADLDQPTAARTVVFRDGDPSVIVPLPDDDA